MHMDMVHECPPPTLLPDREGYCVDPGLGTPCPWLAELPALASSTAPAGATCSQGGGGPLLGASSFPSHSCVPVVVSLRRARRCDGANRSDRLLHGAELTARVTQSARDTNLSVSLPGPSFACRCLSASSNRHATCIATAVAFSSNLGSP
ncbi:hypothetical protein HaLaN_30995 [Haematococcus lacustris]|uniref:Uncharacterized protein n=1 Tax=Haematococcus lacustris TaxID=44745 RepID=A0A6A0AHZ3_HAELA|nr:hypothetical protein HaLaN_30995 [Haematococcus lacustris]